MKPLRRNRSGFTLVELLIVIALIALLMAMLLGAVRGVRARTLSTQCVSNMRQTGIGFQQYINHNKQQKSQDLFPYAPPSQPIVNTGGNGNDVIWRVDLTSPPGTVKWIGVGLLINGRFLNQKADPADSAEVLYCPAYEATEDNGLDGEFGLNRWKTEWPNPTFSLQTPYVYRATFNFSGTGGPRVIRSSQPTAAVFADIFTEQKGQYAHRTHYNVLFSDSHVQTIDDAEAQIYITTNIGKLDWATHETTAWGAFDIAR